MNKKEFFLTVLILLGLVLSIASFSKQQSFDCTQPLFSTVSSCSVLGGSCVNMQARAGIFGLWDHFTGFVIEQDEDGVTISCSQDCFIKFNNGSRMHKKDSANHFSIKTVQ